jgi:hypothetical protein
MLRCSGDMDVGLGIAGFICVAMAFGHTAIGVRWVLPSLTEESLPSTPFGRASMTVSMVRVTWYIVTVFVLGLGGIFLSLSLAEGADPKTLVLRWFAVMWLAATGMAVSVAMRRTRNLRGLLRLPVPFLWVVVAVLCWNAAT